MYFFMASSVPDTATAAQANQDVLWTGATATAIAATKIVIVAD
jgi:hypothetical protein